MLHVRRFYWKNLMFHFLTKGALLALLVPVIGLADPPPNPSEQSVPVQLRIIRDTLAEMEDRLSTQMSIMEANLESSIGDVQSSVDLGNSKLDILQTSVDLGNSKLDTLQLSAYEIIDILTTVNVEVTTELCLDESVLAALDGGAHGEFGVGWPNVLDAKAILQGDAGFGVEVKVGNTICIQIPLYSVESDETLLDFYDFDTTEFDEMIGLVAGGARTVMPFYAAVYGELMPTPEEAIEALDNYMIAGLDISVMGRDTNLYNEIDLLFPDVLLEPVIPDIIENFIAEIPDQVEAFIADPCIGLDASPLGPMLIDDPAYDLLCDASADVLFTMASAVNFMFGVIEDILWCIENPVACLL